ncbi:hypothetical protein Dimus_013679 [Dionaea muscipula]
MTRRRFCKGHFGGTIEQSPRFSLTSGDFEARVPAHVRGDDGEDGSPADRDDRDDGPPEEGGKRGIVDDGGGDKIRVRVQTRQR